MLRSVITGTGSYIPPSVRSNSDFTKHVFYSKTQQALLTPPEEIVSKFTQITGIRERRYTTEDLNASDIGCIAAKAALEVASASKPSPANMRADPASHGLGMRKTPLRSWSARK